MFFGKHFVQFGGINSKDVYTRYTALTWHRICFTSHHEGFFFLIQSMIAAIYVTSCSMLSLTSVGLSDDVTDI